jgi:hypothetical protein
MTATQAAGHPFGVALAGEIAPNRKRLAVSIPFLRARRPSPSLFVAVISLMIASASVAYAAVPDSAGVIHGCITTRTGALRVIDTETTPAGTCASGKERPITWNVQGIQGAPGQPGATGAPGQPGATGAPGPAGTISATYIRRTNTSSAIATVTCDSGDIVTGGGANSDGTLVDVFPYTEGFPNPPSDVPIGYSATRSGGSSLTVYVLCVDATP